jgi:hypothetical protein
MAPSAGRSGPPGRKCRPSIQHALRIGTVLRRRPPTASFRAHDIAAWHTTPTPTQGPTCAPVLVWSRLHSLVGLEIAGKFASMGIDPDQVFEAQLGTLTV